MMYYLFWNEHQQNDNTEMDVPNSCSQLNIYRNGQSEKQYVL